jgi:hypothetical protein
MVAATPAPGDGLAVPATSAVRDGGKATRSSMAAWWLDFGGWEVGSSPEKLVHGGGDLVEGNQGQRRGQTVEAVVSLVGEVRGIGVKLMEV